MKTVSPQAEIKASTELGSAVTTDSLSVTARTAPHLGNADRVHWRKIHFRGNYVKVSAVPLPNGKTEEFPDSAMLKS